MTYLSTLTKIVIYSHLWIMEKCSIYLVFYVQPRCCDLSRMLRSLFDFPFCSSRIVAMMFVCFCLLFCTSTPIDGAGWYPPNQLVGSNKTTTVVQFRDFVVQLFNKWMFWMTNCHLEERCLHKLTDFCDRNKKWTRKWVPQNHKIAPPRW